MAVRRSAAPSAEPAADELERPAPLPNGAVRRRRFDLFGRLRLEELPDGSWLRHRYDANGNLCRVEHASGEHVDYEVADDGSAWSARTACTETIVRLDADGVPVEVEQRAGALRWTIGYRRDGSGSTVACRYPGSDSWVDLRRFADLRVDRGAATLAFTTGAQTVERIETGRPPRLTELRVRDATERTVVHHAVQHDDRGRIAELDGDAYAYDRDDRLVRAGRHTLTYDAVGRLVAAPGRRLEYVDEAPMVAAAVVGGQRITYEYDAVGRRVSRHGAGGTTRYHYDLFGQLSGVDPPDGAPVEYRYDGFGRLVGRRCGTATVHYLVGVDGHRLAEADARGRIIRSYVWIGDQCVGRVDGPLDHDAAVELSATFHRGPTGRPVAVGDAAGRVVPVPGGDPFGADCPVVECAPGFAGLFGDPATGLLHAGSRWLDPVVAQFLTPDTWFGEDAAQRVPRALRSMLDAMPGGTDCELTAVQAYAWCRYDPVNVTDPSGHNWLGLIFSTISSLLWGMQATSLSFQMLMIDFILDLLQVLPPVLRPVWDSDGYWDRSVYNIPAPTASYRLMVPWAFWFNGLLRGPRAFTLGNVIWYSGTQLSDLETASARDRVSAPEIATFVTATQAAAVDVFRARNPNTNVTGAVAAADLATITGAAVTAPAGAALGAVVRTGDSLAVKVVGAATDELRTATAVAADITLDRPLPDAFGGQSVEVRRVDAGIVRLSSGDASIARTIAIVRGQSAHFARQVPAGVFTGSTVTVDEFLPAGQPRPSSGSVASEQLLVDLGSGATLAPFAAHDVVRILSGGTYFAREVIETRPPTTLVLDVPLPTGDHTGLEVVRLLPGGGTVNGQTASGARVTAGNLIALAARDGLAVTNGGGAVERRIAVALVLDCQVVAVPAALQGQAATVSVLSLDTGTRVDGQVSAATDVTTAAGGTAGFHAGDAVEVRATSGTGLHRGIVQSVDAAANRITLTDDLDGGLPGGTAVSITALAASPAVTFPGTDPIAAPGDHVVVPVPSATSIHDGDVIRIGTGDGIDDAVRDVAGTPALLAGLDSALPASHTTNLTVERLTPDASSLRSNASAPAARIRVQLTGSTNPFGAGEFVHLSDTTSLPNPGEEIIGEIATVDGQTLVLRDPVRVGLATNVDVVAVTATGMTSAGGALGEAMVMIPSDPGEDPYTRRDALQNHEMRHVWQYAMWGPFFLSLPIPWLLHVGFSFTGMSNSASKVLRHISVGGLDSLFALLFWGIGGHEGATTLTGTVQHDRRAVQFAGGSDAAQVAKFEPGSRIDVAKGSESDYEVVDSLDTSGSGSIALRFALSDGRFADNDQVTVTMSPFEQVRKTVSTWFSLNLEQLWHDHIPTTWGRALSGLLNRDSWLPGLGVYVLSVMAAGGDQSRTPFEQDAAYHSGDLYTSITVSDPSTVFVGQFTRVFSFVDTRANGGVASVSAPAFRRFAVEQLTVELEGGNAVGAVIGAVPSTTVGQVRFRENWYLPLRDEIGNATGALLAATQPGTYRLHAGGELVDDGVVFSGAADVGALETRRITVRALGITPDPTQPIFETEQVTFAIAGDPTAQYQLRFAGGAASGNGTVNGLAYTAPALAGGAITGSQDLDVTATYAADHPVFRGPGQLARDNLSPEQRTNLCQTLTVTYQAITVPPIGPLTAGTTADAEVPIAPSAVNVGPPSDPAALTGALRVMNLGGRPAHIQLLAPPAVSAPVDIPVEFVFGADAANRKSVSVSVRVTPA